MSRGHDRERDIRELLDSWGWLTVRAAGSLGPVDVLALNTSAVREAPAGYGERAFLLAPPLMIESKSTAGGPYERFGPAKRRAMAELADRAGALAVLAWWPPCKGGERKADTLRWIWDDEWPAA